MINADSPLRGFRNISTIDAHHFNPNAALVIEGGLILWVGNESEIPAEFRHIPKWQDGAGAWVLPGFINSHTHVAMSFMREVAHQSNDMIHTLFFPMEKKLDIEDIYAFSFMSIVAGIKSGVTTFVDHYYHISGVENALTELGCRGFVAETLADLGGAKPQHLDPNLVTEPTDWEQPNSNNRLVRRILGPHAMDTVSEGYLRELAAHSLQHRIPVHMHLSQTQREYDYCITNYGISPVKKALELGILGSKTLAVHLVTANDEDLKILQSTRSLVGLCPSSQIIYERLAPLDKFASHNLPGALGTDCAASHDSMDIMAELRTYYLCLRQRGQVPNAKNLLKTVWDYPARWLNVALGRVAAGHLADLIFIRRDFECEPFHDPHLHLITTLSSRHVCNVMVAGEYTLHEHNVVRLDESRARRNLHSSLRKLGLI